MSKKQQKHSSDNKYKNEWFAATRWHIDDIKRFRPEWSNDFCYTVLSLIESNFEELLIERGNWILDSMIESSEEIWLKRWGYLNENRIMQTL